MSGFFTSDSVSLLSTAGTPTIYNVSALLANTEYSQALSANTKQFLIQCRSGDAKMRIAFASGATTSGPYITIRAGNALFIDAVSLSGKTIYVQSNKASQTIEILEWV